MYIQPSNKPSPLPALGGKIHTLFCHLPVAAVPFLLLSHRLDAAVRDTGVHSPGSPAQPPSPPREHSWPGCWNGSEPLLPGCPSDPRLPQWAEWGRGRIRHLFHTPWFQPPFKRWWVSGQSSHCCHQNVPASQELERSPHGQLGLKAHVSH